MKNFTFKGYIEDDTMQNHEQIENEKKVKIQDSMDRMKIFF
jgi:hypothetical protein